MSSKHVQKSGFTLIELLIVIAIIATLAAVIFVALNPLLRFQDSRDSARWQDVSALSNAIQLDQVDNGGSYLGTIDALVAGDRYMIGTAAAGCDDQNAQCDKNVAGDDKCVNLQGLVSEGYLGEIPVSPNGSGTWTNQLTGYTLMVSTTGAIVIQACESENSSDITIVR